MVFMKPASCAGSFYHGGRSVRGMDIELKIWKLYILTGLGNYSRGTVGSPTTTPPPTRTPHRT